MSKSLQDQLLSLGLAKSKPQNKPRPKPHSKSGSEHGGSKDRTAAKNAGRGTGKKTGKAGAGKSDEELSLEQAYRLREQQAKNQAAQARERKRAEDRRRRELNQKIRNIVEPNRLNNPDAELTRNFLYKGRIRKVNVTAEQFKELNSGALGIVYLAGGYHLLKAELVSQVRSLSSNHVPDLSGSEDDEEEIPVPDDLLW